MASLQRIISPDVPEPAAELWSNCIRAGNLLFISGQTARTSVNAAPDAEDEYGQARIVFGKLQALVESAGGRMADIAKITIYVVNIKNNKDIWRARKEFFSGDFPASTLVEVRALASPSILLEIDAIAYLGGAS
jgi:enamine deaminase RidA (YjgF/YER057c/UK114 family)